MTAVLELLIQCTQYNSLQIFNHCSLIFDGRISGYNEYVCMYMVGVNGMHVIIPHMCFPFQCASVCFIDEILLTFWFFYYNDDNIHWKMRTTGLFRIKLRL